MIRLIVRPEEPRVDNKASAGRHLRFIAVIEGTEDQLVVSRQPLVDGARVLLARGVDPTTLLAIRPVGAAYDSFVPKPIGELARISYTEGVKKSLRATRWEPHPGWPGNGEEEG